MITVLEVVTQGVRIIKFKSDNVTTAEIRFDAIRSDFQLSRPFITIY